jgi:hypothetical protein
MIDIQSSGLPRRSLWRRRVDAQTWGLGGAGYQPVAAGNLPAASVTSVPFVPFASFLPLKPLSHQKGVSTKRTQIKKWKYPMIPMRISKPSAILSLKTNPILASNLPRLRLALRHRRRFSASSLLPHASGLFQRLLCHPQLSPIKAN